MLGEHAIDHILDWLILTEITPLSEKSGSSENSHSSPLADQSQ
jgi:hypothetical protein